MLKQPVLPDIVRDWVRVNPFPTLLITDSLDLLHHNDAFKLILEESGHTARQFLVGHFGDDINQMMDASVDTRTSINTKVTVREGRTYDLHATRISGRDSGVSCCILIPEMQTSDDLIFGVLDSVDGLLALTNADGKVHYTNSIMNTGLGGTEELPGVFAHLREIEHEFSDGNHQNRIQQARDGKYQRYLTKLMHRDGSLIPVELTIVASLFRGNDDFMITARILDQTPESASTKTGKGGTAADTDGDGVRQKPKSREPASLLLLSSPELTEVLRKVEQVAPTEVTVIIEGERGTGKATIVEYIHELSLRADGPFELVNCRDLPPELIESELFGYPKGAFTGAYRDRPGRIEAAEGGTLYIRGIDRLSNNLQSRLLQLLEKDEFVPTGAAQSRKADVRVIASSTVNLRDAVKQGNFQAALLARISSMRIRIPALRDRPGDVGRLTNLCIERFNGKFNKNISGIDDSTLNRLQNYSFPGNDRELCRMIERAFIVSSGGKLPIDIPAEENLNVISGPVLDVFDGRLTEFLSLEEYQRKYIQLVLESTEGKVSGKNGAAEILKVHPQTLFSKMKKLGIKR